MVPSKIKESIKKQRNIVRYKENLLNTRLHYYSYITTSSGQGNDETQVYFNTEATTAETL